MSKIKEITSYLDQYAPRSYQESYDNSGLLVGDTANELQGVMISLDVTEGVIDDAIANNCNVIVSHHPVIFRGIKKLTGSNDAERAILKAIKNDIALYAIHTNLDNVHTGVNKKICDTIGLVNTKILQPKTDTLNKLTTFIPTSNTREVMDAVFNAGAGKIGDYSNCSFKVTGTGTFLPSEKANPHIGTSGNQEEVTEDRVEVIFPAHLSSKIVNALKKAHPYEEVAFYLYELINENPEVGSGMTGELEIPLSEKEFLDHLKKRMNLSVIKHTHFTGKQIRKVAVCGGAGSSLLHRAKAIGAQAFVSADFKYHEYFDADGDILIADIGHYESEIFTKDLLYEILKKNFPNIALHLTKVDTNPILYT